MPTTSSIQSGRSPRASAAPSKSRGLHGGTASSIKMDRFDSRRSMSSCESRHSQVARTWGAFTQIVGRCHRAVNEAATTRPGLAGAAVGAVVTTLGGRVIRLGMLSCPVSVGILAGVAALFKKVGPDAQQREVTAPPDEATSSAPPDLSENAQSLFSDAKNLVERLEEVTRKAESLLLPGATPEPSSESEKSEIHPLPPETSGWEMLSGDSKNA